MARQVSGSRPVVAAELEQSVSDVLVRAGDQKSDLHDERD